MKKVRQTPLQKPGGQTDPQQGAPAQPKIAGGYLTAGDNPFVGLSGWRKAGGPLMPSPPIDAQSPSRASMAPEGIYGAGKAASLPPNTNARVWGPRHLLDGTGLLTTRSHTGGGRGRPGPLATEAEAHQARTTRRDVMQKHSNINGLSKPPMSLHRTWAGSTGPFGYRATARTAWPTRERTAFPLTPGQSLRRRIGDPRAVNSTPFLSD
jgi:hypothetical protein